MRKGYLYVHIRNIRQVPAFNDTMHLLYFVQPITWIWISTISTSRRGPIWKRIATTLMFGTKGRMLNFDRTHNA